MADGGFFVTRRKEDALYYVGNRARLPSRGEPADRYPFPDLEESTRHWRSRPSQSRAVHQLELVTQWKGPRQATAGGGLDSSVQISAALIPSS